MKFSIDIPARPSMLRVEKWERQPNLHCPKCGEREVCSGDMSEGGFTYVGQQLCLACGSHVTCSFDGESNTDPMFERRLASLRVQRKQPEQNAA